jgi:hypothetical protein
VAAEQACLAWAGVAGPRCRRGFQQLAPVHGLLGPHPGHLGPRLALLQVQLLHQAAGLLLSQH